MVEGKKNPFQLSVLAIGVWETFAWWFLQCLIGGIRSIVEMLAVPFRHLYSSIHLLSRLLFLNDSILFFLVFLSHSSFKTVIASYKSSSSILNYPNFFFMDHAVAQLPYFKIRQIGPLYADSLTSWGHWLRFRLRKQSVLFALVHIFLIKYICIPS